MPKIHWKEKLWKHMLTILNKNRPHGFTDRRLEQAKPAIMADRYLWADMAAHMISEEPEDLLRVDEFTYNHMVGNFWGGVKQHLPSKKIGV